MLFGAAMLAPCLASLSFATETSPPPTAPSLAVLDVTVPIPTTASAQAWQWGAQSLLRSEDSLRRLNAAIDSFLVASDDQTLNQSRAAWLESHRQWLQITPLLNLEQAEPEVFAELTRRRFSIDAGDLQPGYLDAVPEYPHSGLINDIALGITASTLRRQHGLTDVSEVSLGFHALELVLWGVDGKRSPADFRLRHKLTSEELDAGYALMDLPNNRRRELLQLLGQMLLEDVRQLQRSWQDGHSSLSQAFYRQTEAARMAWLRTALQSSLQRLGDPSSTTDNAFAGDRHYYQLAPLEGIEDLLVYEPGLLASVTSPEQQKIWLDDFHLQVASLRTLGEPEMRLGPEYTAAIAPIAQRLLRLGQELAPATP